MNEVANTMAEMRVELKMGKGSGKLADRREALEVEQESRPNRKKLNWHGLPLAMTSFLLTITCPPLRIKNQS